MTSADLMLGDATKWLENLVRTQVIENWEAQDEPEHLRTIRGRLLVSEQRVARLLGLYQRILQQGEVEADGSPEQMELRLSGLVVKQQGKLKVHNRIYASVFDHTWVDKALADLRPYAEALNAWTVTGDRDESRLLRGQALQDARSWAVGKSLSDRDYRFLAASQEFELRSAQKALEVERKTLEAEQVRKDLEVEIKALEAEQAKSALEAERKAREAVEKANQILNAANQKASQRIRFGSIVLATSLVTAIAIGLFAGKTYQELTETQLATRIERDAVSATRQFEVQQIEALILALHTGQDLKSLVKDERLLQYPSVSPLLTLQAILDNIWERTRLNGHLGFVFSARFSPDGQRIVTASYDRTARVWDLSGKQIAVLNGHQGRVFSVRFSPNGQRIVTASYDTTARVWDLSGKQLAVLNGHQDSVDSASFSPDGQRIVGASFDGTDRVWDLSGKQMARLNDRYVPPVYSASFSPDGQHIVTVSIDNAARVWDSSGILLAELKGHYGFVYSASFSPDGQRIVTASEDRTARVWDLSGQLLAELKGHHGFAESASFSPDPQALQNLTICQNQNSLPAKISQPYTIIH